MPIPPPSPDLVQRFRAEVVRLSSADHPVLGVAVSGGPDSLALLFLAAAAYPGQVRAATVDHGLRDASAEEASFVAGICADLGVPHTTLVIPQSDAAMLRSNGNLHAAAREWRFGLLHAWCNEAGVRWLATAHHAEDQAETLLMRLARGAGLAGLSGIRPRRAFGGTSPPGAEHAPEIIRPLLAFTKAELIAICAAAGLTPVADPSNHDPRFNRSHARALLGRTDWLDARRLAASAHHLGEAEAALDWATRQEMHRRRRDDEDAPHFVYDMAGLPPEILRRIAAAAIARIGGDPSGPPPRGPELQRLIQAVQAGETATLGHAIVRRGGDLWTFAPAPPRRSH